MQCRAFRFIVYIAALNPAKMRFYKSVIKKGRANAAAGGMFVMPLGEDSRMRDRFVLPVKGGTRLAFAAIAAACPCVLSTTVRAQEPPVPVPVVPAPAQTPADPALPAAQTPAAPPDAAPGNGYGVLTVQVRLRTRDPITQAVSQTTTIPTDAIVRLESQTERTTQRRADSATGVARFARVAEATYDVTISGIQFDPKTVKGVQVRAVGNNAIEIIVDEKINVELVRQRRLRIRPQDISDQTTLTRQQFHDYPLGVENRQSLPLQLRAVPGLVYDSVNQIHPRGENSIATSTYLNGILIPNLPAGRATQFLQPDLMESVTVKVGGIAPEYTGSGAVLDVRTREFPRAQYAPNDVFREYTFLDYALRLGDFDSREAYLNFGTVVPVASLRGRRRVRNTVPPGPNDPKVRYVLSLSTRATNNYLQAPQDNNATNNNGGINDIVFGKFDLQLNPDRVITGLFNFTSGRTDIANRTPSGGSGFAGLLGPGILPSQVELGQNFRQTEYNNLAAIQFTARRRDGGVFTAAVGTTESSRALLSRGTPGVNVLPADRSIEYLPTVLNRADQTFVQADFTPYITRSNHQLKFGAVYHDLDGTDSYQLIPQSQAALNALRALDPRLVDPTGGVNAPILTVRRDGYYAGVYLQDTWRPKLAVRLNYGLRVDSYKQDTNQFTQNRDPGVGSAFGDISRTELLPRVNMSIELPQRSRGPLRFLSSEPTVLRVSYNRLFAQPNLGQGTFIGNQPAEGAGGSNTGFAVDPQLTDMYSVSLERQIGTNKVAKLSAYTKDIKNTLTTGQLISGLQDGTLAVYNQSTGTVDGAEVSFQLLPPSNGVGFEGLLSYANTSATPRNSNQFNNLGRQIAIPFYEYDQQDTLTAAVAYKLYSGASVGLSLYYGSGLYSSINPGSTLAIGGPIPARQGGRDNYTEVNLRIGSGPRLFNRRAGIDVEVANLFDGKSRINQRGAFGTRYQQGRRFLVSLNGQF